MLLGELCILRSFQLSYNLHQWCKLGLLENGFTEEGGGILQKYLCRDDSLCSLRLRICICSSKCCGAYFTVQMTEVSWITVREKVSWSVMLTMVRLVWSTVKGTELINDKTSSGNESFGLINDDWMTQKLHISKNAKCWCARKKVDTRQQISEKVNYDNTRSLKDFGCLSSFCNNHKFFSNSFDRKFVKKNSLYRRQLRDMLVFRCCGG